MGFIILKTLFFLIIPPASLFFIMAAGFFIAGYRPRLGRGLIAGGFIVLYLLSINPISDALLKPLEASAPPLAGEHIRADAIVVLGGGARDLSWLDMPAQPSSGSLYRAVHGLALYQRLHLPVIFVGGNGEPSRKVKPDAEVLEATARSLGIPGRNILLENKSRNTIEGVERLTRLLSGRRIVLVTSAYHMKRAAAMFRKQGFDVIPAPSGYLSENSRLSFYSLIPDAGSLSTSSTAFSEYISLLWYKLSGRI